MKYLLITKKYGWQSEFQVQECNTPEELTAAYLKAGSPQDAIVAQRMGIQTSLVEWTAPAVDADAADAEQKEAA